MLKTHKRLILNLLNTIILLLIPTFIVILTPFFSFIKFGYIAFILLAFLVYGSYIAKRTTSLLQKVFKPKSTINASLLFIMFAYINFILIFGTLYFNLAVLSNTFTQKNTIELYVKEGKIMEDIYIDNNSVIRGLQNQVWKIDLDRVEDIKNTHKNFKRALKFDFKSAIGLFNETFYFSAITMSTIGYGDYVPVSSLARFLSVLQGLIGQIILVYGVGLAFYKKD